MGLLGELLRVALLDSAHFRADHLEMAPKFGFKTKKLTDREKSKVAKRGRRRKHPHRRRGRPVEGDIFGGKIAIDWTDKMVIKDQRYGIWMDQGFESDQVPEWSEYRICSCT